MVANWIVELDSTLLLTTIHDRTSNCKNVTILAIVPSALCDHHTCVKNERLVVNFTSHQLYFAILICDCKASVILVEILVLVAYSGVLVPLNVCKWLRFSFWNSEDLNLE